MTLRKENKYHYVIRKFTERYGKRISKNRQGGVFSKQGVQIATKPTWAFQEVLQKVMPSGGSNLALLGELGGKLLLPFPINRGRREKQKGSTLLVSEIQ